MGVTGLNKSYNCLKNTLNVLDELLLTNDTKLYTTNNQPPEI